MSYFKMIKRAIKEIKAFLYSCLYLKFMDSSLAVDIVSNLVVEVGAIL